jgi:hypothetical protein
VPGVGVGVEEDVAMPPSRRKDINEGAQQLTLKGVVRGEINNAKEKCDKECDMEDKGNKLATTNENIPMQGEVLLLSAHVKSAMHVVESQNQEEATTKKKLPSKMCTF